MRSSREHEHNHYQKYRSLSPLDVGAGDDEGALEIEGTVLGDEEDDGAPLVEAYHCPYMLVIQMTKARLK